MHTTRGNLLQATGWLALIVVLLVAARGSAQYLDPIYFAGGRDYDPAGKYASGLWLLNGARQVSDPLFPVSLRSARISSAAMDSDNRRIVFVAGFPTSATVNLKDGLFRLDPATGKVETLYATPPGQWFHSLLVNQDGDYVFGARTILTSPSTRTDYHIFKIDAARRLTTVLSTIRDLGEPGQLSAALGRNIDSGNYLLSAIGSSPPARHDWVHGVLDVDVNHDGKWTTFSNGGGHTLPNSAYPGFGWFQDCGRLRQDYATGALRTVGYFGTVLELKPGKTPRTTLYVCGAPVDWYHVYPAEGLPDLQSAARPRYVAPAYLDRFPTAGMVDGFLAVDQATYFATGNPCFPRTSPQTTYPAIYQPYVFEPYRGRQIASVKTGAARWTLRFSLPSHPNQRYVAAAGISGVRPPLRLPDGRRIWLHFDDVTRLTLAGVSKPYFDSGPGVLDANGEAQGVLDLGALGPTGGLPVWIALLVLDPNAPLGIAYIPDTQVIRVP